MPLLYIHTLHIETDGCDHPILTAWSPGLAMRQVCTVDDFTFGTDEDELPEPDWKTVPIGKDGLVELL